ncbi:ogr/Delta-like zinc finger family protein [Pseudomonas aeruginosa]|uniref:ogr/Delta-like zinc finger family protein n=2 Tax=Pseudomonas aeruginosa TaxID=287 RepID=UPI002AAAAFC6|nr:ogr/Delta-like zinc finger family protein [Pseudomonas aeruginosa]
MCPPHQETDSTCGDRPYKAAKYLSSAGLGMLEPSSHGGFHHMPNVDNHHRGPGTRRRCPDCGSPLIKRSSASQHLLMSRTFLVCKNVVCGATFAGTDEITHRLSPPSRPNPEICLPYAPSAIRRGVLQVLGLPAEDEQPATTFDLESRP